MPDDYALSIARNYHDAWIGKEYREAAALLADQLEVEVPVNDYPTKDSFVRALEAFGSLVRRVELLAAIGSGDEAMLLYDLDVAGLGELRVVEHFTVGDDEIDRLRQIHDTAAVREAGLADS